MLENCGKSQASGYVGSRYIQCVHGSCGKDHLEQVWKRIDRPSSCVSKLSG